MNYDEAVKEAKKINPDIDTCVEYPNGYMFANSKSNSIGGSGAPFVILKKTGKAVTMAYFNGKYDNDEPLKEMKVK